MKRYMMLALLFVAIAVAQVAVTALCKYLQQKDVQQTEAGEKGLSRWSWGVVRSFAAGSWKETFCTAGFVLAAALAVFVLRPSVVQGESMDGSLYDGELLIAVAAENTVVNRGDIICLQRKDDSNQLVKRVIGMPGDYIYIGQGKVIINGREIYENYIKEPMYKENKSYAFHLEEDEFFVLGDNRNISLDSRRFGTICRDEIVSVAKCGIGKWGIHRFRQPEVLAQLDAGTATLAAR